MESLDATLAENSAEDVVVLTLTPEDGDRDGKLDKIAPLCIYFFFQMLTIQSNVTLHTQQQQTLRTNLK